MRHGGSGHTGKAICDCAQYDLYPRTRASDYREQDNKHAARKHHSRVTNPSIKIMRTFTSVGWLNPARFPITPSSEFQAEDKLNYALHLPQTFIRDEQSHPFPTDRSLSKCAKRLSTQPRLLPPDGFVSIRSLCHSGTGTSRTSE